MFPRTKSASQAHDLSQQRAQYGTGGRTFKGDTVPGWKAYFQLAQTPATFNGLDGGDIFVRSSSSTGSVAPQYIIGFANWGVTEKLASAVSAAGDRWWVHGRSNLYVAYFDSLAGPSRVT